MIMRIELSIRECAVVQLALQRNAAFCRENIDRVHEHLKDPNLAPAADDLRELAAGWEMDLMELNAILDKFAGGGYIE